VTANIRGKPSACGYFREKKFRESFVAVFPVAFAALPPGLWILKLRLRFAAHPPPPGLSSFAHVVVIIQENRTPDNLFQSMVASGVDIPPNGICHVGTAPCAGADGNGVLSLSPTPLAITYDLGHDYNAWTINLHAGAMDHFNGGGCSGGPSPTNAPYRYVQASDIQPYIQLAQTYAFADRLARHCSAHHRRLRNSTASDC